VFDVDVEDPFEQPGPTQAFRRALRVIACGRGCLLWRTGDDFTTQLCVRREHAMESTLLEILHRRYGERCHLIGAGSWPAELYATHADVVRVTCLHRYTAFLFDGAWWRALAELRASLRGPVYVREYDPRKLARVERLLRASGTDPARCLFITRTACLQDAKHRVDTQASTDTLLPQAAQPPPVHWIDRLVCFGRLTALRSTRRPIPGRRRDAPRNSRSRPRRVRIAPRGSRCRA
jgi:hypothetical protein